MNIGYIVEANVPYLSAENPEIGVILDEVNDKCMVNILIRKIEFKFLH